MIINYARKYGRDCNGDGVIDCIDYAAIHIMGSEYCDDPSLLNTEYWLAFQQSTCYQYPDEPEETSYQPVRSVYHRPNSNHVVNRRPPRPPLVSVPSEAEHKPLPASRPTFVPRRPTNPSSGITSSGHVFVNGSELVVLPIIPSETTVPEAPHPDIIYPESDSNDNHSDSNYPENTHSDGSHAESTYPEYPENSNIGNTNSEDIYPDDNYEENTHTEIVYPIVHPVTHSLENHTSVTDIRIVYPEINQPVTQPNIPLSVPHRPVTRPSVTHPPVTRQPVTRPPVTRPPMTRPSITRPPANPSNNLKPTSPPNTVITNPPTTRTPLTNERNNLVITESFTSESPLPTVGSVVSTTVSLSIDKETDNFIPSSNERPSAILPPWAVRFNETKYVPNECLECLCEVRTKCIIKIIKN